MGQKILRWLVWIFFYLLYKSWRIDLRLAPGTQERLKNQQPIIFSHWHGDELGLLPCIHFFSLATMTSTSKDGSLIDFVIHRLGGSTVRGSSTRGGIGALKGLIRKVREENRNTSMAVDGPRGPIYQVKPGVFELSRLTGASIVPLGMATDRGFQFKKSWNKAVLPLFFSRVIIFIAEPMQPITKDSDLRNIKLAEQLKESIFDAKQHATKIIAQGHGG